MKVTVENIIARGRLKGSLDIEKVNSRLEKARYQPEVLEGLIYEMEEPRADIFLLENGMIKVHGVTSEDDLKLVLDSFMDVLHKAGFGNKLEGNVEVQEVIASIDTGSRISPKAVFDEFKDDGIHYDPTELPGFQLPVGNTGIHVLIFPSGKIVTTGASNLMDAVSSLDMVRGRIP